MRFAAEMHSKWENLHVWRNSHFSQDEDHNKQKGEWIHLVLLGMANRCQMGINGPPNVLLQKAFFSAQYFADILSNICIISLRKYFWMEKYTICRMTSLWWSLGLPPNHKKRKPRKGNIPGPSSWWEERWLVFLISRWDWQLAQPDHKCEQRGIPNSAAATSPHFPTFVVSRFSWRLR